MHDALVEAELREYQTRCQHRCARAGGAGGGSGAYPVLQQPMGRSAGACRRRSSRLASGGASAAVRCGVASSRAAAGATLVGAGRAALADRGAAAPLASRPAASACAGGRGRLVEAEAHVLGTGGALLAKAARAAATLAAVGAHLHRSQPAPRAPRRKRPQLPPRPARTGVHARTCKTKGAAMRKPGDAAAAAGARAGAPSANHPGR